tara:strand:- start:87 stop:701 length:615 start_codon:yes stop_codon:yes gene_type:complete
MISQHDDISDCDNCTAGKYNPFVGHGEECFDCISADTANADSCNGCSPGKFLNKTGAAEICTLCPLGRFTDDLDLELCYQCPSGFHGLGSTERPFQYCHACPKGKFGGDAAAAVSVVEGCQDCSAGRFSEAEGLADQIGCEGCPAGRWSNVAGLETQSRCVNCGAGLREYFLFYHFSFLNSTVYTLLSSNALYSHLSINVLFSF